MKTLTELYFMEKNNFFTTIYYFLSPWFFKFYSFFKCQLIFIKLYYEFYTLVKYYYERNVDNVFYYYINSQGGIIILSLV